MKKCFFNLIGISTLLCFVSVPSWADTDDCENCKACCYDTAEDLKYEECCELNDKYEFVSSFTEDGILKEESMCCVKDLPFQAGTTTVTETCCGGLDGTNERNGNEWVSLVSSDTDENKCCKVGTYRNYKGDLTPSCCVSYGVTEIGRDPNNTHYVQTEKFCAFVENPSTKETVCCAKGSSRECGAGVPYDPTCVEEKQSPSSQGMPSKVKSCNPRRDMSLSNNKLCCLAAGGMVVEGANGSWICCTTFGVRKKGDTVCQPKDGISDDFNSIPDVVIVQ